jgi:hypothetical protein
MSDPLLYANTPATMNNRLALERAIIMDDKEDRKANKALRRERRANGGGFGTWAKDMTEMAVDKISGSLV